MQTMKREKNDIVAHVSEFRVAATTYFPIWSGFGLLLPKWVKLPATEQQGSGDRVIPSIQLTKVIALFLKFRIIGTYST